MTDSDILYRAVRKYREILKTSPQSETLRGQLCRVGEGEKLTVIRTVCEIDEDWVETIERGLPFIGKAIDEDRQFILSNGDVQPIEKVKHISRESIEHLARHSNYLSREQDEGELLPEKLYTVERLNDYAVYENRFLYLLLCELENFVNLRYQQLIRQANSYRSELTLKKSVISGGRELAYEINLNEKRVDDPLLREHDAGGRALTRIEWLLQSIHAYLRTPLMMEIAKTDKLKPPIAKTNVLRMDKNFKETVALYDYILAYDKPGFTCTRKELPVDLENGDIAGELAEPVLYLAFLTYEHGLGIEPDLRAEYEREEARQKEAQKQLLQEQLESLRGRAGNMEEYLLLLERRNRILEQESLQLAEANAELARLGEEIQRLQAESEAQRRAAEEQAALHAKENAENAERIENLQKEQNALVASHTAALLAAEREKLAELKAVNAELEALKEELITQQTENTVLKARLTALKKELGRAEPTQPSEEAFGELEHELEVFSAYVRGEWKNAKKLIREEYYAEIKKHFRKKSKRNGQKDE